MNISEIKVIAFDLDGTLTQHRTPLAEPNISLLDQLRKKYHLLMVGAGKSGRIFNQMNGYPIDIIGNYGMQFCRYNNETHSLDIVYDEHAPCDRESVTQRLEDLRVKYGYTEYAGKSIEFHDSGCVTFPFLGTEADIRDKLAFDPDRSKRRAIFEEVKALFPEYTAFVGGSSSFDFAPKPFNKYYALDRFCRDSGLSHENVVYAGDDYGVGGNDEAVYRSDFRFICVDDYTRLADALKDLL
ncbi:MAG: HAD-IIB family hydrolase [Eubacteriales bacterium]|nr:HAD-IIB family hydrolase [Eubacteriales bacterium]